MGRAEPVALVTGGSRGIGRGICLELARLGMGLAIHCRGRRDAALEVRREALDLGAPWAEVFTADLARSEDRHRLVEETLAATDRIDLLVNNAGIASPKRGDLLEVAEENWDTVLETNLKGPFFLSQAVARGMIERRDRLVRPMILFITSISAETPSILRGDYCVSKSGLAMVSELLAHRLAPHGIAVHEIRPGIIKTDMTAGVTETYDRLIAEGLTPIRRWGTPEDVGRAVAALAGGSFPFSTGDVFHVDGGFHSRHL